MDDKKTIEILLGLLKKYAMDVEEKEAVHSAIGILSWSSLAQSRLKGMKEKKDRESGMSVSDASFRGSANWRRKARKKP